MNITRTLRNQDIGSGSAHRHMRTEVLQRETSRNTYVYHGALNYVLIIHGTF